MARTMDDAEQVSDPMTNEEAADATGSMVGTAKAAAETAREMAATVADQLPSAAGTARSAVDTATRQMEASSDEMLMVGAALAFGVTIGLFISGTNRLAVALALVPAAAMGATLMDRRTRAPTS